MKKLITKDRNHSLILKKINKKYFVLKSILKNKHFSIFVRNKSVLKLKKLSDLASVVSVSNKCVESINKKRFNKFTLFSRFIYLKLIRNGKIPSISKSSW